MHVLVLIMSVKNKSLNHKIFMLLLANVVNAPKRCRDVDHNVGEGVLGRLSLGDLQGLQGPVITVVQECTGIHTSN